MNIRIDLFRDFVKLINQKVDELVSQGFEFDSYESWKNVKLDELRRRKEQIGKKDDSMGALIDKQMTESHLIQDFQMNQVYTYLDFEYRIVESHPRKIVYAKEYCCPSDLKVAVALLENKIENGESLFPHLSRQIFKATAQDGMLFDWGIHHLHLGTEPDRNHPRLVQGENRILYVIFDAESAYFLTIRNHGAWANRDLLRIVKDNFPQFLDPYELKGIMGTDKEVSEREHSMLRKAGVNPITEIDGRFYFSPGGGINSAGGSSRTIPRIQFMVKWYEMAEKIIEEYLPNMIGDVLGTDPDKIGDLSLSMDVLESDQISVTDSNVKLKIVLKYAPDRRSIASINVFPINET